MKIGIGDADVPGDQAIASDLNQLLGHEERAVHQSKVADAAAAILTQRERATGITGDIVAKLDGVVVSATEEAKNLRRFAIKSFAEVNVRGNGIGPPIGFHPAVAVYVAHWDG